MDNCPGKELLCRAMHASAALGVYSYSCIVEILEKTFVLYHARVTAAHVFTAPSVLPLLLETESSELQLA